MASGDASSSPRIRPWQWFILAASAPIVISARKLNLDLWHDEIYTVITFVARGPRFICTDYSLANNHVFYSLVLWPFYCVSDSDLMLRLPSLIFTTVTLALVFRVALRRIGLVGAVIAAALLGLNQMFLIHTIQVRGYGLSMCLVAWLTDLALAAPGTRAWRRCLAISLVGAAFLYVMPTNLLFFVPLAAAALADRWFSSGKNRRLLALDTTAWGAAGLLALLAYLPIADQIAEVSRRSPSGSWRNVGTLMQNFFSPALHDLWWLTPVVLAGAICGCFRFRAADVRVRAAVPLLCAVVGGAFLLSGALHISPFERNYCPLLPLLALAAGWSLDELAGLLRRRWPLVPEELLALAGCALLGLAVAPALISYPHRLDERRRQVAARSRWPVQDGYYNYYAADYRPSELAAWLADQHIERSAYAVCYAKEDHLDVAYYLEHIALPIYHRLPRHAHERPVEVFAVLPDGCPWDRLAERCRLSPDDIRQFEHIDDFGYHQLYRSRRALHLGLPADNGLGE